MQKRNVLNSPRLTELKKRRHRAILNKILISVFGLTVIFSLLTYISRLNNLNISEIEVIGNQVIDTETVKATVEKQIAGKYLWLFPKTNILFYPQNVIKKELQSKFKRLKGINLSIKNNKILEVSLIERKALYTWCGATVPTDTGNADNQKCYFLDEDGYVFDEAPYFSGEVYFKFYGISSIGIDLPTQAGNPLGSYYFNQNFKQLVSFKDTLINIGLKPVALNIKDNGDIEIFLSKGATSLNKPKIILKADANFQNVTENLEAALSTDPLKSNFKNKYSSLLYIDLRFGNKVYYKFQ